MSSPGEGRFPMIARLPAGPPAADPQLPAKQVLSVLKFVLCSSLHPTPLRLHPRILPKSFNHSSHSAIPAIQPFSPRSRARPSLPRWLLRRRWLGGRCRTQVPGRRRQQQPGYACVAQVRCEGHHLYCGLVLGHCGLWHQELDAEAAIRAHHRLGQGRRHGCVQACPGRHDGHPNRLTCWPVLACHRHWCAYPGDGRHDCDGQPDHGR